MGPTARARQPRVGRRRALGAIGAVLATAATGACSKRDELEASSKPTTLTLFHAGSLSVPFRELSELYQQRHPHVRVQAEAAGSRDTARKVSDLGRPCDVLGSADYDVVDSLLIPKHASFNIRFATNAMGIVYTERARGQAELSASRWPDVLLRDDVTFGRSDPNRDPCGYRTEMVFQLAERHYARPGLAAALTAKHGTKYIRPKETDLLALLESGELDYIFLYRSVAVQHHLKLLELPVEINLESPALAAHYAEATVSVTGAKPGQMTTATGTPINYSVTIPHNAEHRAEAEAYVALLLSADGQEIMRRNGQPPIVPALVDDPTKLPASLARCCTAPDAR